MSSNPNNSNEDHSSLEKEFQKSSLENVEVEEQLKKDKLAKAESFKEQGNQEFKNQNFPKAISLYTLAIENSPHDASYYGNRSFAYLKSEFYGYALQDANKSIELDSKYIKGYYRRASSYLALGKFKLALKDYEYVWKFY